MRNLPISRLLSQRISALGLTNNAVAAAVGVTGPTIAMIKGGATKMPIGRTREFAEVLEIDARSLLLAALKEYQPELLALVMDLLVDCQAPADDQDTAGDVALSGRDTEILLAVKAAQMSPRQVAAFIKAIKVFADETNR